MNKHPGAAIGVQFARYAVVGAIAFAIDYLLTAWLWRYMPLLLANTLGFAIANVANFLLAHRWVFGQAFEVRTLWRAYVAVFGLSVGGLLINDAIVWLWAGVMALPLLPGKVIATLVALVWNYAARRLWIYPGE